MAETYATEENLDLMQIYKAVIAARNNVTAARNGPSVEIRGNYLSVVHVCHLVKYIACILIYRVYMIRFFCREIYVIRCAYYIQIG